MDKLQSIMECMSNDVKPSWDDIVWLIEQAEKLKEIADAWDVIETDGTEEDADNFFTIVQDIFLTNDD